MRIKLTLLVGVAFLAGCQWLEPPLVAACEEAAISRLLAPSGYKRIKFDHSTQPLDAKDLYNYLYATVASSDERKRLNDLAAAGSVKPELERVRLEYDAPNTYGTPIRTVAVCEFAKVEESAVPRASNVQFRSRP